MRVLERFSVGAVAAMTAPAFLVFPVLGLWYVARVWPGMSLVDRSLVCGALAAFFVGVPFSFRRGIERIEQGHHEGLRLTDIAGVYIPILAGGWALTHRLDEMLFTSVWGLWGIYRAYKTQPALPARSGA